MKKIIKNKKIMLSGVVIITLILTVSLIFIVGKKNKLSIKQENQIFAHTNEGIIKEEEYNGIKFSNISMLTENDYTTFTADITNVSDSDISKERLHVVLKDGNGKEVIKYLAYFPGGLKKGETKTIEAIAHGNFTDAEVKEITE